MNASFFSSLYAYFLCLHIFFLNCWSNLQNIEKNNNYYCCNETIKKIEIQKLLNKENE